MSVRWLFKLPRLTHSPKLQAGCRRETVRRLEQAQPPQDPSADGLRSVRNWRLSR
jgi:hypothetical protein